METFRFYHPIQVRYGDLDPQWHVNNANFLSYLEQARFSYLVELGLFDGHSFFDVGLIVADIHIAYLLPIDMLQRLRVGTRVTRIGTKSITFESQIEEEGTGKVLAKSETVMVAFDYKKQVSKPVPIEWRAVISQYEGANF
jgi:acyl-CoA thioester hydrolase